MSDKLQTVDVVPMQLLASAIEHNVDPDRLGKLLELQERWERNQAEKAFSEAMHAAQQEIPAVVRDAENNHTRKRYALLETIQKQAKPVYEKHGFCLSFGESDCPLDKHKRTVCDVTHTAGHTRRYHIDLPVDSSGSMNAIQGCISTTSYAQRRLTSMIFNITIAGEDDDGQGATRTITADQAAELRALIMRTPPDDGIQRDLLAWAEVDSLEKVPASKFATAKHGLEKKVAAYEGRQ